MDVISDDRTAAATECEDFTKLYANADIALVQKNGTVVASVGCDGESTGERHIVTEALAGKPTEGISARGCGATREPTYLVARPTDDGAVVAAVQRSGARRVNRTQLFGAGFNAPPETLPSEEIPFWLRY